MYLGIDVGGTKTLVGCLTNDGVIKEQKRFPTPKKYSDFLIHLTDVVRELDCQEFRAACIALPGRIDRKHGVFIAGGNLPWRNEDVYDDLVHILHVPVVVENDANLAALSEAMLLKHKYDAVLYLTVSTGIGGGVVRGQKLDPDFLDMEPGHAIFEHHGKVKRWETFASGKAIVEQFGKKAEELNDQKTWKIIVRNLSAGFLNLIANVQPDVIVIGGSVGTHFDKYGKLLVVELKKYETPLTPIPPIIQAQRPEEAVLYGCYDLAKERYGQRSEQLV